MKRALLTGMILTALAACSNDDNAPTTSSTSAAPAETPTVAEAPSPELGNWGFTLDARDLAVQPGDDFHRYASGTWLKEFEIPADRTRYGAFSVLADRVRRARARHH